MSMSVKQWPRNAARWVRQHKKWLLLGMAGLLGVVVLVQLFYPSARLLPLVSVDRVEVGGWYRQDAVWELDQRYKAATTDVYFGDVSTPQQSPTADELGIEISNEDRLETMNYPWYLRLVPSSLLWAHHVTSAGAPSYQADQVSIQQYVTEHLGESCDVPARNASFTIKEGAPVLVSAENGGRCEVDVVVERLVKAQPSITAQHDITIPVEVIPPAVDDAAATQLIERIFARTEGGVTVRAGQTTQTIPTEQLYTWLEPVETDESLDYTFSLESANGYLNSDIAPHVTVQAGVTRVTTRDFVEVSRQDGPAGRALDGRTTLERIKVYIDSAQADAVEVATRSVAPRVEYTRSYSSSDRGLSALIQHYAEDNPGTYGVSLIELSGERRRAEYRAGAQYTTASTYKLFVAYSTLKRVEDGTWRWSDNVHGGRDLAKCFDDMIVQSDNPCAEVLLEKIGYTTITNEMRALGLTNTTFLQGDTPLTTAGDLSLFNALLESDQMLAQQASRDRLLGAMRRNVHRQGIPAGASGQVADKVGFLNKLLHDSAVVYAPSGTYVLTIMTEDSSWARIAELTREIERLRSQ